MIRRDVFSTASILALTVSVAAVFPFGAIGFKAVDPAPARVPGAAFVQLRPDEEAAALQAAKNSWNAEAGGVRRLRAELFFGELPETASEPALGVGERTRRPAPDPVAPGRTAYLPSMAAPPPPAISPEKGADGGKPAFSRDDLLDIGM